MVNEIISGVAIEMLAEFEEVVKKLGIDF